MSYTNKYHININLNKDVLLTIINDVSTIKDPNYKKVEKILQKNPLKNGNISSKSAVYLSYREFKKTGEMELPQDREKQFLRYIQMKKIRTLSGVSPVTVLTKPFFCPGKCIFCPTDIKMPKSYISNEPGAQRAFSNKFDPYAQVFNRLVALRNMGHPTQKVELIILGGTWGVYPEMYQIWFVKRCFDALNDFGSSDITQMVKVKKVGIQEASWKELFKSHLLNEAAQSKCVGLSIETRPDFITKDEVTRLRRLGVTKVQIGIQSLDDKVLAMNNRGHIVAQTKKAMNLLRLGGFKIHAHWMPNLYGSDLAKDRKEFVDLFRDDELKPDELKIYPCMLLKGTELEKLYKAGKWKPYSDSDLVELLTHVFIKVPRYCRITRVIRDFSSGDIVAGSKKSNLRQIVEKEVKSKDIRAREIRDGKVSKYTFKITKYKTKVSTEYFLEYLTTEDKLIGFLRLSLPEKGDTAMVRELHVYGKSTEVGKEGKAQHLGFGKKLIKKAKEISKNEGYVDLAVISAVGTREYYRGLGFRDGELYQFCKVKKTGHLQNKSTDAPRHDDQTI